MEVFTVSELKPPGNHQYRPGTLEGAGWKNEGLGPVHGQDLLEGNWRK